MGIAGLRGKERGGGGLARWGGEDGESGRERERGGGWVGKGSEGGGRRGERGGEGKGGGGEGWSDLAGVKGRRLVLDCTEDKLHFNFKI